MAIDKTGKWWVGDKPNDLHEYLIAYSEDGYLVDQFRLATCECGSVEFRVEADDDEGVARRTCVKCKMKHFICDSGEYWEDAEPEKWKCVECKSTVANVGVGFALYEDKKDIHWVYIGTRCSKCGVLGCFAGWKIGYGPSLHLIDEA